MIVFAHPLVLIALLAPAVALVALRGRRVALLPRAVVVALLLLAVAGPQRLTERITETVVFLVDQSPSVRLTVAPEAIDARIGAIVSANPGRRFAAVAFAAVASASGVATASSPDWAPGQALGEDSDLAAAADLALAVVDPRQVAHWVLVSDGRFTSGRDEAVRRAQQAGIQISCAPVGVAVASDVALTAVRLPDEVSPGQPFTIHVETSAEQVTAATLSLYREGELIHSSTEPMAAGVNRFAYVDTVTERGAYEYRVVVKRDGDPWVENDGLAAFTRTADAPRILLVTKEADPWLATLLESAGRPTMMTADLPSLEGLSGVRQIIVSGVPLADLSALDLATLDAFVSQLGGSLTVVEGEEELRGFAGVALERLLPVSYNVPEKAEEARIAVVFLLDRSSSMRGQAEGATKIRILQEAAVASVRVLTEEDLAGILAFDRRFAWLSPIEPVGDGEAIYERLRALQAEGGTDIYGPVVEALDRLDETVARAKHIILLSDGRTVDEYRDYQGLYRRLQEGGEAAISISVVAIGEHPNLSLLRSLTEASGGTLFEARDITDLPEISVRATQQLSRGRFITGEIGVAGPLVDEGLPIPPLAGYALTYAKESAEVLLWAGEDPLLARWRYGRGQVAAVNTDLAGRWTAAWTEWSGAAYLIDTILAALEPHAPVTPGLAVSTQIDGGELLALADAVDTGGGFVDGLELRATLLPDGETAPMEQVGAGLYVARLPLPGKGGYSLQVVDATRSQSVAVPFSVPYRAEYRATGIDEGALAEVAVATGGRILDDGSDLPPRSVARRAAEATDLHAYALLAALAAFLVDLALRKLPRWRPTGR